MFKNKVRLCCFLKANDQISVVPSSNVCHNLAWRPSHDKIIWEIAKIWTTPFPWYYHYGITIANTGPLWCTPNLSRQITCWRCWLLMLIQVNQISNIMGAWALEMIDPGIRIVVCLQCKLRGAFCGLQQFLKPQLSGRTCLK